MAGYNENRRADAVPRLHAVSKNEAAEGTDLRRTTQWEKAREALAEEMKKEAQKNQKRSFKDLVKK